MKYLDAIFCELNKQIEPKIRTQSYRILDKIINYNKRNYSKFRLLVNNYYVLSDIKRKLTYKVYLFDCYFSKYATDEVFEVDTDTTTIEAPNASKKKLEPKYISNIRRNIMYPIDLVAYVQLYEKNYFLKIKIPKSLFMLRQMLDYKYNYHTNLLCVIQEKRNVLDKMLTCTSVYHEMFTGCLKCGVYMMKGVPMVTSVDEITGKR